MIITYFKNLKSYYVYTHSMIYTGIYIYICVLVYMTIKFENIKLVNLEQNNNKRL